MCRGGSCFDCVRHSGGFGRIPGGTLRHNLADRPARCHTGPDHSFRCHIRPGHSFRCHTRHFRSSRRYGRIRRGGRRVFLRRNPFCIPCCRPFPILCGRGRCFGRNFRRCRNSPAGDTSTAPLVLDARIKPRAKTNRKAAPFRAPCKYFIDIRQISSWQRSCNACAEIGNPAKSMTQRRGEIDPNTNSYIQHQFRLNCRL